MRRVCLLVLLAVVAVVAGPVLPVIDGTGSLDVGAPTANLTRFSVKPKIVDTLVKDAALTALLETEVDAVVAPIVDGTGSLAGAPKADQKRFTVKPKIDATLVPDAPLAATAAPAAAAAAPKSLLSVNAAASTESGAATKNWEQLHTGIRTHFRGNPCRFLITFGAAGWDAAQSQAWNSALFSAAKLSKLGVSNQVSVSGPSDVAYTQREFHLTKINDRFKSLEQECGGKQVVIVVAAAEGSIVANEFLNLIAFSSKSWIGRTAYYNVDGSNAVLENDTVKALAFYYPVIGNKLPTTIDGKASPLVPSVQFADMGNSFRTLANRHLLVLDAANTACTTPACIRAFLLSTSPAQAQYLVDTSASLLNLVKNPAKPAPVKVGATAAQAAKAEKAANPAPKPVVPNVPQAVKCGPTPSQLIGECQSIHEHCSGTYILNKCPGGRDFMCCLPDQPANPVNPAPAAPAKPVQPAAPTKPVQPTPAKPVTPVNPAPAKPVTPVNPAPAKPANGTNPAEASTAQLIDELIDRGVDALGDVAANAINKLADNLFGPTPAANATAAPAKKPLASANKNPALQPTVVKCGAGKVGSCKWLKEGCDGSFQRGLCPGAADYQCCLPKAKAVAAVQRVAKASEPKLCKEAAALANAALRTGESSSRGLALEYVTKYIEAAGISFFPSDSAAASGKDLVSADFKPIAKGAALQPGDIRVFPGVEGHADGHIQVYTAAPNALWVSDYKQATGLPSNAFKSVEEDAYTYRYVCRK